MKDLSGKTCKDYTSKRFKWNRTKNHKEMERTLAPASTALHQPHCMTSVKIHLLNMAILDISLCPRCAIPPLAADNRLIQRLQSSIIGCQACRAGFPPKLPLPLWGSSSPLNTLFLGPSPLIITNGISIGSAVYVWVPNAMLYNALLMGQKTPKNCPFPLGFHHPARRGLSHSHRQHSPKNW